MAPVIGAPRVSTRNIDSDVPIGPDTSTTANDPPPKINQKTPPKPADTVFSKLGKNKAVRSPVRKLTRPIDESTDEPVQLTDYERLVQLYKTVGNVVMYVHQPLGVALMSEARQCADAWFDLAEQNDKVRRLILALSEGGGWGKVIMAHVPLIMATLPRSTIEQIMLRGMGMFAQSNSDEMS